MASNPFLSFPLELLRRILHSCDDFSGLVALASCCKTFHMVWRSQASSLIWELAPARITAFNSALIAVRATKIVADAQRDGVEPPHPFPVKELSGRVKKPLPEEMNPVFDFEHLVKCVEWMMFYWKEDEELKNPDVDEFGECPLLLMALRQASGYVKWPVGRFPRWPADSWTAAQTSGDRDPRYHIFRERLYRGLYNVLLAGAVCSRPYNAPFFSAEKESRMGFLERCARCATDHATTLTDEDIEYLRRFPVYNIGANDNSKAGKLRDQEYESLFGPLAEWLIEDGARTGLEEKLKSIRIPRLIDGTSEEDEDTNSCESFDGSQAGSIREIKTLLGAYEHFHRKVSRTDLSRPETEDHPAVVDFRGQRIMTAVIFGHFSLDEISTPAVFEESENGYLFAKSTHPKAIDVREVLNQVAQRGPYIQDSYFPARPPEFQLFSFMLKRYFDLMWKPNRFDREHGYEMYMIELKTGDIFHAPGAAFAPGGYYNDSLVMYRVPVLSFD